jgi:microcystin-dependent protein
MSNPFVAEIRMFGFNYAPPGWAMCDGQFMPISQNTPLFSLLGTTYGGDGKSIFGLPNLQGACPLQPGEGHGLSLYELGESGGESSVTLLESEIPAHNHNIAVRDLPPPAIEPSPAPTEVMARSNGGSAYTEPAPTSLHALSASALGSTGGGLPHNNLMPYLVVNFCIALQGVFPARS